MRSGESRRTLAFSAVITALVIVAALAILRWPDNQAAANEARVAAGQATPGKPALIPGAARYDSSGKLLKPDNLPEWVFLGASLGMGYSAQPFDQADPGMFQVALMEPSALQYFEQHGRFADGTMIALYFYGSAHRVSTNRSGFVLGGEMGVQVHVVDKQRFTDGHAFFDLGVFAQADAAEALPPGNGCVSCHKTNAAYDGVFAQFYPRMKPLIPASDLARAMSRGTEAPPPVESH